MLTDLERDLAALADTLRASSVAIRSAHGRGSGSGIVWADGLVVTNAHVAQTPTVEVETADGRRSRGTVERHDAGHDLAAIRVDTADLRPAQQRDPGDLRVGEMLVAFGHPLGIRNVLSTGIAFGPHRSGGDRFVRSDIRLEPGNSGGALADIRGRVVGINSMIAGSLGLAIPTDDVRRFMGEAVPLQRLGVQLAATRAPGRKRAYVVLATERGSAAERAGIIPGDIIISRNVAALAGAASVQIVRGGVALRVPIDRHADGIAAAA